MCIRDRCTNLPSEQNPLLGLFVLRRLEKMGELANVRALIPQPWFPVVRPRKINPPLKNPRIEIESSGMFYVPRIANHWNGHWMKRCVGQWLDSQEDKVIRNAVVDAHFGYPEGVGCFQAARERGLPVFITIRGLEVELFNTPSRGSQLLEALCEATGVIAVSHSLKAAAIKAGVPARQITVIPNGVDATTYCMGDKDQARADIGYRHAEKLIVSVGNLKPVKGHDILIRAIAEVKKQVDVRLVCVGGGVDSAWGNKLQQLVNELGLSDRVRFAGAKAPKEVADWLRAADLFALASRREGCCNAVLEALSSGVPVAVTDAGDNAVFVKNLVNGQTAPVDDPQSLANAIVNCLKRDFNFQAIADSVKDSCWSSVANEVIATFMSKLS